MTSIGTAATPVGYAVADRPSLCDRAPTPPAYVNIEVTNGRPSGCAPWTCIVQTAAAPSAMTDSGSTWASAVSSGIGRNMPTTWRGCTVPARPR